MWRRTVLAASCALGVLAAASGVVAVKSKDAYIRREGNSWTFGTSSVERVVAFEDGKLLLKSLKSKASGRELCAGPEEFSVTVGGTRISGSSGGWTLIDSKESKLSQGELQLDITLRRDALQVTKSYLVHPGSSLIREWVSLRNTGSSPLRIKEPGFLDVAVRTGDPESLDFHWMSGGESMAGSWTLKTEQLAAGQSREFDSYDPFPHLPGTPIPDGVDAKILLNDHQAWPAQGWQRVENGSGDIPFDLSLDVKPGDRLVFLVNMHEDVSYDTTNLDPTISYESGESFTASTGFSAEQGRNGWRYEYVVDGQFRDLECSADGKTWHVPGRDAYTTFIQSGVQHPGVGEDIARVWIAPKAGKVHVKGAVANGVYSTTTYRPRPANSTYAPWYALLSRDTGDGVFVGWDYFGHWASSFDPDERGGVRIGLKVAGFDRDLAPGESIETPKAFTGLFRDDLDNAGNECLDWQYRYMWDYTRPGWFPAIRMLGYWYKGTGWVVGDPLYVDYESTIRKVFRTADLMRYVGGDVYHRDWGWWAPTGDWAGPDWRPVNEYLAKNSMGMLIYAPIYGGGNYPAVMRDHPDWTISGLMNMAKPEVVKFLVDVLSSFRDRWGTYEWRTDGAFTPLGKDDENLLLGQDQGFRAVMKGFLDRNPDCAFQACNGGGNYASYDYIRYSSCIQMTDGGVGILSNYYASLLFPPEKTCHMPDSWDPDKFDKATWHGLLSLCFDMTGDTWDPTKLEGLREMIDIYHYLLKHGVVGRWVKVYRPQITGDDPTMYLQRMSGDRKKGIIVTKHEVPGVVTIKPKGLIPNAKYHISFHEGSLPDTEKKGFDLMRDGIRLEKVAPGELIYLNLPMHPGSKLDAEAPTPPSDVRKQRGENLGYPGIELTWKPGTDNNWISYYRILRDGKEIDKVSKGTYYFDHSAGTDLAATYQIVTVDGAGNASEKVTAQGAAATRSTILDDRQLSFTGAWNVQSGLLPAYRGTTSASEEKGASAETQIEGKQVLVFAKLGEDCGKASISIDGATPEIADTYSADDIWGACIYRKPLTPGKHTLRIEVLGDSRKVSKGARVVLDGVRVEK